MTALNNFSELHMMDNEGKSKMLTTFTCGHCSNITVMHPGRLRPRNLCLHCSKWICEDKKICNEGCTPLSALADNHFEDKSSHSRLVNAIMSGAQSSEEAQEKGLIILP